MFSYRVCDFAELGYKMCILGMFREQSYGNLLTYSLNCEKIKFSRQLIFEKAKR